MGFYSYNQNLIEPTPILEFIDLGLPSGTKWANCNLGAFDITDNGKYFMWGECEGHRENDLTFFPCCWERAPFNFGKKVEDDEMFKATFLKQNPSGRLPFQCDAVTNMYGKGCRIPTSRDFEELFFYTQHSWKENFFGSGVNGWKFTSRKGANKFIFIPASGRIHNKTKVSQNNEGFLWVDDGCSKPSYRCMNCYNFNEECYKALEVERCFGLTIRGVCDA